MTSTRHTLKLRGCAPVPLAHYLKALGILRLVSQQADPQAEGWWERDVFYLRSTLNRAALLQFFLDHYSPTPLVGPWGARSGFFRSAKKLDSEKSAREAIERLAFSGLARFASFTRAVNSVREMLKRHQIDKKPEKGDSNAAFMRLCRAELPEDVLQWLDAAFMLSNESAQFPPMLGTGGNEGSGSYASGFVQQLTDCLLERRWDHALVPSLFAEQGKDTTNDQTPGHFLPGSVGGANAGTGFEGTTQTNPWDYTLSLEGTLVFAAAAARRLIVHSDTVLSFPFTVRCSSAGYSTAAGSDEKQSKKAKRKPYETWLPLWYRPTSFAEVEALFSEGRANLHSRRAPTGVDFARAIARHGTERGIDEFQRIGFLERNGPLFFACSLGRFRVRSDSFAEELLAPLDSWLDRFRRAATGKNAPARAGRALRRVEQCILNLCQRGSTADVQALLIALGHTEATIALSKKLREGDQGGGVGPLPLLSPDWLRQANDDSREFRLAAALASVSHDKVGPLRRHLEPVDPRTWHSRFPKWAKAADDPAIVWGGGGLVRNLNAVLARRLVDVLKTGKEQHQDQLQAPLRGRVFASLGDIAAFIEGRVEERRIELLLRGLMLLNWRTVRRQDAVLLRGPGRPVPDAAYALLKLCNLPHAVDDVAVKLDPSIVRRAMAGDIAEATRLAARRLRASGLPPAVNVVRHAGPDAHRIAAALIFPISRSSERRLIRSVLHRDDEKSGAAAVIPDSHSFTAHDS